MENIDKYMVGMFGVVLIAGVMQMMFPPATQCCPICPDVCFYTYEELYEHFTTQHPAEPIDIIWE